MPRPGRVGPGVRIAVQRASSMDALRAAEVKAMGQQLSPGPQSRSRVVARAEVWVSTRQRPPGQLA